MLPSRFVGREEFEGKRGRERHEERDKKRERERERKKEGVQLYVLSR